MHVSEDLMSDDVPDEMTDEGFTGDPAEGEIEDGGPEEPFGEEEADTEEAEAEAEDEDEDEGGARPADATGDEEEDEPDPDEVEADLDAILKDRIAASDDDDEEDEGVPPKAPSPAGLVERQETEIHCPHCFLLVQAKTVAEMGECGHCGGPIS